MQRTLSSVTLFAWVTCVFFQVSHVWPSPHVTFFLISRCMLIAVSSTSSFLHHRHFPHTPATISAPSHLWASMLGRLANQAFAIHHPANPVFTPRVVSSLTQWQSPCTTNDQLLLPGLFQLSHPRWQLHEEILPWPYKKTMKKWVQRLANQRIGRQNKGTVYSFPRLAKLLQQKKQKGSRRSLGF